MNEEPCLISGNPSLIIGINGPRGGGKTLLLSYFGARLLTLGYNVWSNYKIEFTTKDTHYAAKPIDMNQLFAFSPDFCNGFIFLDEAQYLADSRRSTSNANRLLDAFAMQIRKRNLHFFYTAKFFEWIDNRIRLETDVLIQCRDACHTPWGKEQFMKKGEVFNLEFRDMSGVLTGYMWREQKTVYPTTFYGKKFHHVYDSNEIIDVFEAMRPVKNELGQRVISDGNGGNENAQILNELIMEQVLSGRERISKIEFQNKAYAKGIKGDPRGWARGITSLGVKSVQSRNGDFYDLSNVSSSDEGE